MMRMLSDKEVQLLAQIYEIQAEGHLEPLSTSVLAENTGIPEFNIRNTIHSLTVLGLIFPEGLRRAGKAFIEDNGHWSITTAMKMNQFCDIFLTELVASARQAPGVYAFETTQILAQTPFPELNLFEFNKERMVEKGLLALYKDGMIGLGPRLRATLYETPIAAA